MLPEECWTLIDDETGIPVLPLDDNPGSADEGMLLYLTEKGAQSAAQHQRDSWFIACTAVPLRVALAKIAR